MPLSIASVFDHLCIKLGREKPRYVNTQPEMPFNPEYDNLVQRQYELAMSPFAQQ